jgi:hypothetical protein
LRNGSKSGKHSSFGSADMGLRATQELPDFAQSTPAQKVCRARVRSNGPGTVMRRLRRHLENTRSPRFALRIRAGCLDNCSRSWEQDRLTASNGQRGARR